MQKNFLLWPYKIRRYSSPLNNHVFTYATTIGSYEMASPLVCLFVTFGESHSRMLIDWATGEQNGGGGNVIVNEQGKELSVRLLRIILAVSSVQAQFPIQVRSHYDVIFLC